MIFKTYNIQAVATFRDYVPESDVPCGTCNQCCISLSPNLTPEEFESGKYVYTLLTSPNKALPQIAIPRTEKGCYYFDGKQCTIYDTRPIACRQFDCRLGHYGKFAKLVKDKFDIDITTSD
jgi:Fe-S-cluster containining protein